MAASIAATHIISSLHSHKASNTSEDVSAPLFVAFQGPQGIGKTTMTNVLASTLASHNIRVAVLSLDDFYLPYDDLVRIADSHPVNRLLHGRGQPGTHDVELATSVLHSLNFINRPGSIPVSTPIFDKSLRDGKGDRSSEVLTVQGPLDVVIFEGWCVGFHPISENQLRKTYTQIMDAPSTDQPDAQLRREIIDTIRVDDVLEISNYLKSYVETLWPHFSCFVQLAPPLSHPYSLIYRWRLEQEHSMKLKNGNRGMSDEQVKLFIDRYIPGYIFFSRGVQEGASPWHTRGLRIILDADRQMTNTETF